MSLIEGNTAFHARLANGAARGGLLLSLLAVIVGPFTATSAGPRHVLLLHSYGREFAPFNAFSESFRTELAQQLREPLDFRDVNLEAARFEGEVTEEPLAAYLQSVFEGRHLDLLVPVGGPATRFAQRHRNRLFPETPMLIAGTDCRHLQQAVLTSNDAAITVSNDLPAVVANILQVLPDTTNVVMVIGKSPLEKFWAEELSHELSVFTNRLTFTWFNELSFLEMRRRVAILPPRNAILFTLLYVDAEGVPHVSDKSLRELHAVANSPIFGIHDTQLGLGIVGGPLMGIEELGRNTATAAVRILRGEAVSSLKTPPQLPGKPVYDWRELKRWGISQARLPAGSLVRFHQPTIWERYWWQMAAGTALLAAETLLVIGLLANLAKRRQAEKAMRELGGRLLSAQEEERARVAKELHDGLSQDLALMAVELDLVGQKPPAAPEQVSARMQELSGRMREVSGEVHRLSHALHPAKLQQLGLAAAISGFCRELEAGGGITVRFVSRDVPRNLPGDVALCLYRVAQEALQNVVKHSGADRANVELSAAGDTITLAIADEGKGFAHPSHQASSALGLISMRERIRLIHGEILIESKPGEGTRVHVRVPFPMEEPK